MSVGLCLGLYVANPLIPPPHNRSSRMYAYKANKSLFCSDVDSKFPHESSSDAVEYLNLVSMK